MPVLQRLCLCQDTDKARHMYLLVAGIEQGKDDVAGW